MNRLATFALLLSIAFLAACGDDESSASTNLRPGNSATCEAGFTNCDPIGCIDTSSSVEHCGACGNRCPTAPNAVAVCEASCQLACADGFVDADGDLGPDSNGCEYACTPSNDGIEICDGRDNDCDTEVDEEFELDAVCTAGIGACAREGTTRCADDGTVECSAMPRPAIDERCGDGIDNDCDGETDEDDAFDAQTFYLDADDDTYGVAEESVTTCVQPDGYADRPGDCDDTNPTVHENAVELCDDLDNDCDNDTDETFTTKGDPCTSGLGVCEEAGTLVCAADGTDVACDAVPGQPAEVPEQTCDGIDGDCDGEVDNGCDDDLDGWCDADFTVTTGTTLCGGGTRIGDCVDDDDTVFPTAPGACDGKDNDCNGIVDDVQPTTTSKLDEYTLTGFDNPRTTAVLGPVVSAPMADGFCVAAYDQDRQLIRFFRYRPGATTDTKDLQLVGGATDFFQLLDLRVSGDRCALLFQEPDLATVRLAEWNSGLADTIADDTVTVSAELDRFARRAALGVGTFTGTTGQPQPEWVIAWYNVFTIGTTDVRNLQYSRASLGLGSISANRSITLDVHTDGDVAVGPPFNPADSFSVVFRKSITENAIATVDRATANVTVRSGMSKFSSGFFRPVVEVVGSTAYLAWIDAGANTGHITELLPTYAFGRATNFPAAEAPARDYTDSNLFGPGILPDTVWYTDTAGDIARELSTANPFATTAYDHDALTYFDGTEIVRHHTMSTRVVGDVVQYLVLDESKPGSPTVPAKDHSLFVSEFTCY